MPILSQARAILHRQFILAWLAMLLAGSVPPASAAPDQTPVTTADVPIFGLSGTLDPVAPVVPRNMASRVSLRVHAGDEALDSAALAAHLSSSFDVRAELSGPGLPASLSLSQSSLDASPTHDPLTLHLPALSKAGDYILSNIRIEANGADVLVVSPGTVVVKVVEQVLVTSVLTRPLTLDEIREKGILLDHDDYLGFEFTLGLYLESKPVEMTFPVVFDRNGVVVPNPPFGVEVYLDRDVDLPLLGRQLIPMLLTPALPKNQSPLGLDEEQDPVPIPALLVLAGNVGTLKQFFSAQLIVANALPQDSGMIVRDITSTIRLPAGVDQQVDTSDDPLVLADTEAGQSFTQPLLIPVDAAQATGGADRSELPPGEQAQAEYLIRGDQEGFHPVTFDIDAVLEGPSVGVVSLKGTASGGVLVRNPYFEVTFTVPEVVRIDEEFPMYVTLSNLGQGVANDVRVSLDSAQLSGLTLTGESTQGIETLVPGDSRTVKFDFVSNRTGSVRATYLRFSADGSSTNATGQLAFAVGVDERGVQLSPDTLVLPSSVRRLPSSVVNAAMRVLGQAWSVARLSPGALPDGIVPIPTQTVEEKALLLAEAGLRVELEESIPDALRGLIFDMFGGEAPDPGFDQVLRETSAGAAFAAALGAALQSEVEAADGVLGYERDLARLGASGPPLVTFAVTSAEPLTVALSGSSEQRSVYDPAATEPARGGVAGTAFLPIGSDRNELLGLLAAPSSGETGLELSGPGTISLSMPRWDGIFIRGEATTRFPARLSFDLASAEPLSLAEDQDGDGRYETSRTLSLESFLPIGPTLEAAFIIGPETLSGADRHGLQLVLRFDRVVSADIATSQASITMPANTIVAKRRQLSGRLVFAALELPEGPYVPTSVTASNVTDARDVVGPTRTVPVVSRLKPEGGIVSGRILKSDQSPLEGADLIYFIFQAQEGSCGQADWVPLARIKTDAEGRYDYHYIHESDCNTPATLAVPDPRTGAYRMVHPTFRWPGERLILDIALVDQGDVEGSVLDLTGQPVPDAKVLVLSKVDYWNAVSTRTDGEGRYLARGLTVGPVTVLAQQGPSLGQSAGRIQRAGTSAAIDVSLDGGAVQVSGQVFSLEAGATQPRAGVLMLYEIEDEPAGYAFTDEDGRYTLPDMPSGSFRIAALSISTGRHLASLAGVALAGDTLSGLDLLVEVPAQNELGSVTGVVLMPDGSPAPNVIVGTETVGALETMVAGVLTDENGAFELPGLEVGVQQTLRATTQTRDRKGAATVQIPPQESTASTTIWLPGLGSVEYTVVGGDGQPLSGQTVGLLGDCQARCGCRHQVSGADGKVRFDRVPLGAVKAVATRTDKGFHDLAGLDLTLKQDGDTAVGTLAFSGEGSVMGEVLAPEGVEVASGGYVRLSSSTVIECVVLPAPTQRVPVSLDGLYRFDGVRLGSVSVQAEHPFFPTPVGAAGVLTREGEVIELNLRLVDSTAGELTGTVLLPDGLTPAGEGVEISVVGLLPEVEVKTDTTSRFGFARILPAGAYTLTARDPVTGGVAQEQLWLVAEQDLDRTLRLKGRGTVWVSVVDGADNPATDVQVVLRELSYPHTVHQATLDRSTGRTIAFEAVVEGPFVVEASDAVGRDGLATGAIVGPDAETDVEVQLTVTGTVTGRFVAAGDRTPIPFGVVRIFSSDQAAGITTTAGTGDVGHFSFPFVTAGSFRVEAFDPLSQRAGVAYGTLELPDQEVVLEVATQGIGTVEGVVLAQPPGESPRPEPGASVQISSGGFDVSTSTDAQGRYRIDGVPEGLVRVSAFLHGQDVAGSASGPLSGEGDTLTLDVTLTPLGEVRGWVVESDGVSPAQFATVALTPDQADHALLTGMTDLEGHFHFPRVPKGVAWVSATAAGSIDRARILVDVPAGPLDVGLALNGVGALTVHALDSRGDPLPGLLTLQGTGTFPFQTTLEIGSSGQLSLAQVLAGPFTAVLKSSTGGVTLYGSAAGIVLADQIVELSVQVEPSGTVRGTVLRPDGESPAAGASVILELAAGRGQLSLQAGDDGSFMALGVPLGGFGARGSDALSGGVFRRDGLQVSVNGEVVELGNQVLDNTPIRVVSIDPPDAASEIPLDQPVRVTFSDAVRSTTGISVTSAGASIPLLASLSADGLEVLLTGPLPDDSLLEVFVSGSVQDIYGRPLGTSATSGFHTVDLSPPVIASTSPVSDALQVGQTTEILARFDEPLAEELALDSLLVVTGPAGAVAGTVRRSSPDELSFTASPAFEKNTRYSVVIDGAIDRHGNVQTAAYRFSFATEDTIAPVLGTFAPSNGTWLDTARPVLSIGADDILSGLDTTRSKLKLDGAPLSASWDFAVQPSRLTHTLAADLADGKHQLDSEILDRAGNAARASASFWIDTQPPMPATLSGVVEGATLSGTVALTGASSDSGSGIARVEFLSGGEVILQATAPTLTASLDTFSLTEGPHLLTARAVDAVGNVGLEGPGIQVLVDNFLVTALFSSPAQGTVVRDSVHVVATGSENVARLEFSVGDQRVVDETSPYEATLDTRAFSDGELEILATASTAEGDTGTGTLTVIVDHTPPAAPDGTRITAEPPVNGGSLVYGRAGAVESGARVEVVHVDSQRQSTATADDDGAFSLFVSAAVGDLLSLQALDGAGNRSPLTELSVLEESTLEPGVVVRYEESSQEDRVGSGAAALTPDGATDAVFTFEIWVGNGVSREISYIDLVGPSTRSTRPEVGATLGVATTPGGPLVNNPDGQVRFPVTTAASLTLFAAAPGFLQEGATYKATAVFADGAQFIGSVTLLPPERRPGLVFSARILAHPPTVEVPTDAVGTTLLTLTNLRDFDGNPVPDGARVALSVTSGASTTVSGAAISSAGGNLEDGEPAADGAPFQVYTVQEGSVVARYSSGSVHPPVQTGSLAVLQVKAADSTDHVLGSAVMQTYEINLRASSDRATVHTEPPSLYADKVDRRSQVQVALRNSDGTPAPDGTAVAVTASYCGSRTQIGNCLASDGGTILGGEPSPSGSGYRVFRAEGGAVSFEFSAVGIGVGSGGLADGLIQILPAAADGTLQSSVAIGTGRVALTGAASAELRSTPGNATLAFPVAPVTLGVHQVRDARGNPLPAGARLLLSATQCATRTRSGNCISSAGGTVSSGDDSPAGAGFKAFTLQEGGLTASFTVEGIASANPGAILSSTLQLVAADAADNRIDGQYYAAIHTLPVAASRQASSAALPPSLLADGGAHRTDVTFYPVLDAYGRPLPDGSKVLASVASCAGRTSTGNCISSAGGAIVNGELSPLGAAYRLLPVVGGAVVAAVTDEGVTVAAGEVQWSNVVLLGATSTGTALSSVAFAVQSVQLVPPASATPELPAYAVHLGGDFRARLALTDLRDSAGQPLPDGTLLGLSATSCATRNAIGNCITSAGGALVDGTPASFGSGFRLYPVSGGRIDAEFSTSGISLGTGQLSTSNIQVLPVTPDGQAIGSKAVLVAPITVATPGSASFLPTPVDLYSDGGDRRTEIVIHQLLEADGVTGVPDGATAGLTGASCGAKNWQGNCIYSAGGTVLATSNRPGDGGTATNNTSFRIFTQSEGLVRFVYSAAGLPQAAGATSTATVAAVPARTDGSVMSTTAFSTGEIRLRGMGAAAASGPESLSSANRTGTVVFSDLRDTAGNPIPEGALVVVTATSCATRTANGNCITSIGGSIVDGTLSPSGSGFRVFAVADGQVSVTYSCEGTPTGTAAIQLAPAAPDGKVIGNRAVEGGVWIISITQ